MTPRPLLFLGGKGGVGKTTVAAACAALFADRGQTTLLVSTDPAHSVGDVLGADLSGEPTAVRERLDAVEIDGPADAAAHVERLKADVAGTVSPETLPAVRRHLDLAKDAPGTIESAVFDRVVALMDGCPDRWERIVFDTAPTGHTLRLLAMPAMLTTWVEGLARQREKVAGLDRMLAGLAGADSPGDDPILRRLQTRRSRYRAARRRLLDDAALWLVLVPERLPIEETARAERALTRADMTVGGLIVNRVLPADADGDFLAARREQQADYLDEIARRFPGRPRVRVAQQRRDVAGPGQLARVAEELAAAEL
ncbi:MAG: ArsA family ATPase [Actinomycetota bacterium]|nr:ArsA family ATPase [Actinomycetota bacterium]